MAFSETTPAVPRSVRKGVLLARCCNYIAELWGTSKKAGSNQIW